MSFTYEAKSEEQLQKEGLTPEGIYDFEVVSAEDSESKKGNPMIVIKLRIFTGDSSRLLTDYIVSGTNYGEHKFRSLAMTLGLVKEYESGNLTPDDFIGCGGRAQLGQQPAKDGYSAKNTIKSYVYKEEGSTEALTDSIPF